MKIQHDLKKRYWLFDYARYYPSGGMFDLEFTTDSLDEALAKCSNDYYDHNHILDTHTGEIVGGNDKE